LIKSQYHVTCVSISAHYTFERFVSFIKRQECFSRLQPQLVRPEVVLGSTTGRRDGKVRRQIWLHPTGDHFRERAAAAHLHRKRGKGRGSRIAQSAPDRNLQEGI